VDALQYTRNYNMAKYDLNLKQFDLHSIIDKNILVLGIGGGNDAVGAFIVASIIKKAHPERNIIYGSCLSARKKNYIGFSQITDGLYIRNLKNDEFNENHSLRLVQTLEKFDGDLGRPYVIIADDTRENERISKKTIDYFSEYALITIDNGGDSFTGGKDKKKGFDYKNLMYFKEIKLSFLHIVLGLGCDGESTIEFIEKMLQFQSQAVIGDFELDEFTKILSPMITDIQHPERKNVDTTVIIHEANNHMLNNPQSEELYLIPRHERNIRVPYAWINKAIVFNGQKLYDNTE